MSGWRVNIWNVGFWHKDTTEVDEYGERGPANLSSKMVENTILLRHSEEMNSSGEAQ